MSLQFQCLVHGVSAGTGGQIHPMCWTDFNICSRALVTCHKILAQLSKQVCTPDLYKPSARNKFGDL